MIRGAELLQITEKLKLLIEICLLREIGFEAERIRDLVKEGPKRCYLGPLLLLKIRSVRPGEIKLNPPSSRKSRPAA